MNNITRTEKAEIINAVFNNWNMETYQKSEIFTYVLSLLNTKQKDNLIQYIIDNYEQELNETLEYLGY